MELRLFYKTPETQTQIDLMVQNTKDKILSGNYNPLDLEIQLKAMEEVLKRLRGDSDIKEYVITEAERYPEKTFKVGSVTITKSSRKSYDYSQDDEWKQLKAIEADKVNDRKVREKKLRDSFVDSDSGEIVEAISAVKSTSFLTIKFDK